MKVAVILGAYSIGKRPLDFWYDNIWTCLRGLTGTDLATVMISKELSNLGHEVSLFTVHAEPNNKPDTWEGVKLYNFIDRHTVIDESYDAILTINEPDVLRGVCDKPFKMCWQFLNDFSYCLPNYDDFVDMYLSPCEMHRQHMIPQTPIASKWKVLALGCDPNWYTDSRVPGRVVWCSSPDRGLHWLLSQWPKIKKAVPYASLKIFYNFDYDSVMHIEPNDPNHHPHVVEMAQRARYMKSTMEKLKPLGVEHFGSISRERIAKEWSEASVLGFSCDTVAFSEGFSVTILEAHASYTVPVITDKDCLGSIYKDSGAIVIPSPVGDNLDQYSDAVIKSLTDKKFADNIISKCTKFADNLTWAKAASRMQDIIKNNKSI